MSSKRATDAVSQVSFLKKFADAHPDRYADVLDFTKNINKIESICKNWMVFAAILSTGAGLYESLSTDLLELAKSPENILLQFTEFSLWTLCDSELCGKIVLALRFVKNNKGDFCKPVQTIPFDSNHLFTFRCVNPNVQTQLVRHTRKFFNADAYACGGHIIVLTDAENNADVLKKCADLYNFILPKDADAAGAIAAILPLKVNNNEYRIIPHLYFIHTLLPILPGKEALSIQYTLEKEEKEAIARNWIERMPPPTNISANQYYTNYSQAVLPHIDENDFTRIAIACGYRRCAISNIWAWVR